MKKFLKAACLLLIGCFIVTAVQTAHADPVLSFRVGPAMNPDMWQDSDGAANGDGTHYFSGSQSMMGMWNMTWDVTADQDPFINAQFGFQNTSMMTQQFVLAASIPISPDVVPSSLYGGSFGGSLTDANGSGSAVLSTVMGSPMYYGEIDGTGVLPIYPHETQFSVASFGQTTNIPAANVGLGVSGPTIPGPIATNSIGITHIFTLTPGDSVSFTSFFAVEAIPEPATMGLIGLIAGGIYFTRRFFMS